MASIWHRTAGRLRRLIGAEDGNATIEFALIVPAFFTFFLMSVEVGVLLVRGAMLNRAVDLSMRELRLGTLSPMSHDGLKDSICDSALIIPDCANVVLVELRPISTATWSPLTNSATCVDRNEDVQPVLTFQPGTKNDMMLVRVCAVFDPFFPSGALASSIKLDDTGAYAMVTTSAYVNEP